MTFYVHYIPVDEGFKAIRVKVPHIKKDILVEKLNTFDFIKNKDNNEKAHLFLNNLNHDSILDVDYRTLKSRSRVYLYFELLKNLKSKLTPDNTKIEISYLENLENSKIQNKENTDYFDDYSGSEDSDEQHNIFNNTGLPEARSFSTVQSDSDSNSSTISSNHFGKILESTNLGDFKEQISIDNKNSSKFNITSIMSDSSDLVLALKIIDTLLKDKNETETI